MPFDFIPNQSPSIVLPQSNPELSNPLGIKAVQRTGTYLDYSIKEINGERQVLGGKNKGDKWFGGQIGVMCDVGYLPEDKSAYVIENPKERKRGYNPVPHRFVFDKTELKNELNTNDLPYVRVAGDQTALKPTLELIPLIDSSSMCIAPPGDLRSLHEMLYIINEKLHGRLIDYPLIIENRLNKDGQGYWDETLRGIKVLQKQKGDGATPQEQRSYINLDALASHMGIYVTENRESTMHVAKELSQHFGPPPIEPRATPVLPDGATIFVTTSTDKKYQELERILLAQGVKVKFRSIYELIDYVPPDENQLTFEGNAAIKIDAALKIWEHTPEEIRVNRMQKLGLRKNQIYLLSEDSGYSFVEPNLIREEEFNEIRHLVDPYAPFPGTETGPAIFAGGGILGFMKKMDDIRKRRPHFNDEVVKKCVLALAPLEQSNYDHHNARSIDMHMIASEVRGHSIFKPHPDKGSIEIDNFLVPENGNGRQSKTEAELGEEFYLHSSPRALAWKALATDCGMTLDPNSKMQPDYSHDFITGIIADRHSYTGRTQAEKLQNTVMDKGFGAMVLDSHIERPEDIQNMMLKSDGFVLHLDPDRYKQDFWRNLTLISSMVVAEQIVDKVKYKKPFYIVDSENKFKDMVDLIWDLHYQGMISQDPNTLLKVVPDVESAITGIRDSDRYRYRRVDPPEYALQKEPNAVKSKKPLDPNKFRVAILCSALNENEQYLHDAKTLTEGLIDMGCGVVSGAGIHSQMGMVTNTAHDMLRSHKVEHAGSSSPNTLKSDGDASEMGMAEFLLARHIYERIEYIADKSDGFALMSGGAGSVQELAMLAWLKDRALQGDAYAQKLMGDKAIVIVNSQVDGHDGSKRGFYDKLIRIIPPEDFERLGIHVVGSTAEAMDKFRALAEEKTLRAGASITPTRNRQIRTSYLQ